MVKPPEAKSSLAMSRSSTLQATDSIPGSGSPLERTMSTETTKGHKRTKSFDVELVRPNILPIYRVSTAAFLTESFVLIKLYSVGKKNFCFTYSSFIFD